MKYSSVICSKSKFLFWTPAAAIFLLLVVSGKPAPQDPNVSQLSLTSTEDGFNGAFRFEGRRYAIENLVRKGYFRTRIADPNGRSIVRAVELDRVIVISLPSGNVKVDIASPGQFSDAEIKTISDFVYSEEAALVRRIVYEVRNQRVTEKLPLLKGFQIIAMFLGDGDVTLSASEKRIDRSKLTFKMANHKCDPKLTSGNGKPPSCDPSNCCGCCGPGCWGCSGCYLQSCMAHDQCVDSLGYFSPTCMRLLALAVAEMEQYCPRY